MNRYRFASFSDANPDALAIVDASGREWSRGEVACCTNRLSRALRRRGLKVGDVMALVAPNSAEYLIAYLAGTQMGLYVVPVNTHLAPGEVRYIVENSGAKALVVHSRFEMVIKAAMSAMPIPPPVRISLSGAF